MARGRTLHDEAGHVDEDQADDGVAANHSSPRQVQDAAAYRPLADSNPQPDRDQTNNIA